MKIFYEDNHIIVAYKPSGILSQSDGSDKKDMLTLLKEYIKEKYNKPGNVYLGLVHRLDINTSGVMVFARTSKAAARLSLQIQNHIFKKKYLALVEGTISDSKTISLMDKLGKNEETKTAYISPEGKTASLEFKVLAHYKLNDQECTLIDVNLFSGRFHQIRCQMSNYKHPIYGDKKYGSKNIINKDDFPLQAYSLSFNHPTTNEILCFTHINNTKYIKYNWLIISYIFYFLIINYIGGRLEIKYKNNYMQIDNYKQIYKLTNDLIVLEGLVICGKSLNVIYLDKDRIEISGEITKAYKGENNEISYNNEQGWFF